MTVSRRTAVGGGAALALIASIWFGGDLLEAEKAIPAVCVSEDAGPLVCTCRTRDGSVLPPWILAGLCECRNRKCAFKGPAGHKELLTVTVLDRATVSE